MELPGEFVKALDDLAPYLCFKPYEDGVLAYGATYSGSFRAFYRARGAFPVCLFVSYIADFASDVVKFERFKGKDVIVKMGNMEVLLPGNVKEEEVEFMEVKCLGWGEVSTAALKAAANAAVELIPFVNIKSIGDKFSVGVAMRQDAILAMGVKSGEGDVDMIFPSAALYNVAKAFHRLYDRVKVCWSEKAIKFEGRDGDSWLEVELLPFPV
ncbi:MAG: hypothetical protein ACK4SY_06845 [Pyrobaculum sp.]